MTSLQHSLNTLAKSLEPCILLGARHQDGDRGGANVSFALGVAMPMEVHPVQVVGILAGLRTTLDKLVEQLASGLGVSEAELRNAVADYINKHRLNDS